MPAYQGLHAQQAPRHHKNFPPQGYADLNKADIKLLGRMFAAAPPSGTPAHAAFEQATRQLIAELPAHLRSRIPWLSTLCSKHKKLNSLPIISLWNALKREVDAELTTVWSHVCLTPAQSHFINRLMQYPWHTEQPTCAACALSHVASDNDLLIALGSITLATLSSRNWKKSKRVCFLQGLMEGRAAPGHAEGAIQKMFELGAQLKALREGALESSINQPDPIKATSNMPQSPPRPPRSAAQEDHLAVVVDGPLLGAETHPHQGIVPETGAVRGAEMAASAPSFTVPRKPVPGQARRNVFEHAFHVSEPEPCLEPDAASSVYPESALSTSRQSMRDSKPASRNTSSPDTDEGEILDLYRHSVFPKPEEQAAAGPALPAKVPSPRRKNGELARSKLPNITIPRSNYGGEGALRTSVLWKRRAETTAPRFRIGKNGEIKGPFDSKAKWC